nr:MAG TPA: hypothetical protein [Caudoviricetes sp.]
MRVSVAVCKWVWRLACCGLVTGLGCFCRGVPLLLTPPPLHCCPCPLV